ncbi:hypothetical protein BJV74DRAFT_889666 [Russula compacta]|nr:hypothetical protein BJV74DRAFT_889666 [Russula compacta]
MDVDPPLVDSGASTTSKKRTAAEAEISGGETEPASDVPVKVKWGRPAGSKNKPKVAQAPEMKSVQLFKSSLGPNPFGELEWLILLAQTDHDQDAAQQR